jgi:hypothetical protein
MGGNICPFALHHRQDVVVCVCFVSIRGVSQLVAGAWGVFEYPKPSCLAPTRVSMLVRDQRDGTIAC